MRKPEKCPHRYLILLLVATLSGCGTDAPDELRDGPVNAAPVVAVAAIQRYVVDLGEHTPAEVIALFDRARTLARDTPPGTDPAPIAMVIHGADIDLFARHNSAQYRELIDRAAALDRDHIIDFKACATTARARGLGQADFPDFIELIPYAPDALADLKRKGYARL